VIICSALVAATGSLGAATQTQNALATGPTTALMLANEIHTLALSLPRTPGDGTPAHAGAEVAVLDDLDGASFSPPIDARRGSLDASSAWTQSVRVDPVSLATPAEADESLRGTDSLLKLTVTVRQGGAIAGSYTWWIDP